MKPKGNPNIRNIGKETRLKPGHAPLPGQGKRGFRDIAMKILAAKGIKIKGMINGKQFSKVAEFDDFNDETMLAGLAWKAIVMGDTKAMEILGNIVNPPVNKLQIGGDPDNPTPIPIVRLPAKDPTIGDDAT